MRDAQLPPRPISASLNPGHHQRFWQVRAYLTVSARFVEFVIAVIPLFDCAVTLT